MASYDAGQAVAKYSLDTSGFAASIQRAIASYRQLQAAQAQAQGRAQGGAAGTRAATAEEVKLQQAVARTAEAEARRAQATARKTEFDARAAKTTAQAAI